jgi:o-succinylbenzoate synthase
MMELQWQEHILNFIKPAKTSRGEYIQKKVCILELKDGNNSWFGEASPLPDLSIDGQANIAVVLEQNLYLINKNIEKQEILESLRAFPSIQFALECCFLGMNSRSTHLFNTPFTQGQQSIAINGLIWMDNINSMEAASLAKIEDGYQCIKFKVGALDHDSECRLIEKIRQKHGPSKVELRLDANGAFAEDEALDKIKDFAKFNIHSIEQPIAAGQWDAMQEICRKSKIPVALDEELIGIDVLRYANKLIKHIGAQFLILKPTLLGGFSQCNEWIKAANKYGCSWWATSALESNIGLGHIAQWVSTKKNPLHQGLGTGNLYDNNFPSSTHLIGENMWYQNTSSNNLS